MSKTVRIINSKELLKRVPYCLVQIGRLEKAGKFPKRVKLGEGPRGRVGWIEEMVDAWIIERANASGISLAANDDTRPAL
jgi:prophage regulatory protein